MERLFNFWTEHVPLSDDVKSFFKQHGLIETYKKGIIISQPDKNIETWNFVLDGLVAGTHYTEKGKKQIRWFALPHYHFTTTSHLFTRNKTEHIEVLKKSTILQIPRIVAQQGQQQHIAISELFHVLLQKRIKQYRRYILVMQEENTNDRYAKFIETMSEIVALTYQKEHCQYIRMSNGSYQNAKNAYVRRR